MAEIQVLDLGCEEDGEGERGKRGKRGKRGHRGERGHDGRDGATGPTGATGATGTTGATGPTGAPGSDEIIAVASIIGVDGSALANTGFSSTSRVSAGIYRLTLASPPPDAKVVPVVTTSANSGVALGVAIVAGGVVTVVTFGASGFGTNTPGDTDFFIIVSQGA